MMPILDGPGMVEVMRRDAALLAVPIILMSAVSEAAVRKRFDGYSGFVRKRFRLSVVLKLVASIIGEAETTAS
jgi:hypothetical protein